MPFWGLPSTTIWFRDNRRSLERWRALLIFFWPTTSKMLDSHRWFCAPCSFPTRKPGGCEYYSSFRSDSTETIQKEMNVKSQMGQNVVIPCYRDDRLWSLQLRLPFTHHLFRAFWLDIDWERFRFWTRLPLTCGRSCSYIGRKNDTVPIFSVEAWGCVSIMMVPVWPRRFNNLLAEHNGITIPGPGSLMKVATWVSEYSLRVVGSGNTKSTG